jgi:magnesium transporter
MDTVAKCALYVDGTRERDLTLEEIGAQPARDGEFMWIGIHEPTPEQLRAVQQAFKLHDLAIEDALRAHQRPKAEEYGESLFVVVRTARWDEARASIEYGETHVFVGAHYIVTVRHGASSPYKEVRARSEAVPHLLRKGPAYALYAILDFVVDRYFPVIDAIESAVEDLEDNLFSSTPGPEFTRRAYELLRELGRFKRIVQPLLEVFGRLTRVDLRLVSDDIRLYFRDIYDHVVRINESLEQLRETVHSALEANLALISVRQNDTMQMLAAWAAILAIPTLVAGIFGMNFDPMPGATFPGGFLIATGAMLLGCVSLFGWFRRIGWV